MTPSLYAMFFKVTYNSLISEGLFRLSLFYFIPDRIRNSIIFITLYPIGIKSLLFYTKRMFLRVITNTT